MRFLVVDDSTTMRRFIINTLNKVGYKDCVEAANGREGMKRLAETGADIVITDWNMPEMTGIEFIRAIRANPATKDLPVLMVTTNAAKDDIIDAMRDGINSYVLKPFTSDIIKQKIEAMLAAQAAHRAKNLHVNRIPKEFLSNLIESTQEVFETMVFQPLGSQTPTEGDAKRPHSNVVGTVAFAGEQSGIVAFYSTTETANAITGGMLGMPAADVNGKMPDAIGEITNMIAGTFRTKMASSGPRWAVSIPTVTIGSDFYTKYMSDVRRVLCPFTMSEGQEVFVELILTKN